MGNKLVKQLIEAYLEILNTLDTQRFVKKIKFNKIKLLLGLKLPGIRKTLNDFRNYIKNELREVYLDIEKELKFISINEDDSIKQVENCNNKIKAYHKNMETEIIKNELFQKLIECGKENPEDNRQFYEWLLEDYYLLFLSDTLTNLKKSFNNLEEYKNFLKKMVFLRFNAGKEVEEVDPLKSFAMKIVWLESNSQYISILLKIYQKISVHEKNLLNKIDKIIDNHEINYEISERSPKHTEEINSSFFFMMESLLKIITTDFEIYNNLKDEEFYDFINSLKEINQDALRLVNELIIFSKEVFTIQEFLLIEEKLNNVNKSNINNILNILNIISDHTKFTNILIADESKYQDLSNNVQKLYDFLLENLGNTNNFIELILNVFVNEIKKLKNGEYRKKLVEIILNNPNLISKSYEFISIIIKTLIDNSVDSIMDNLDNIKNNKDSYIILINNANNDALNEIIISIFENQFNSYFDSISSLSENDLEENFPEYLNYKKDHDNSNPCLILLDKSLDIFKSCLNLLEEIFNNRREKKEGNIKNEHICQLYCISYIKMYIYKCIYFNHTRNQDFTKFDQIVKAIEGTAKNSYRKMIKLYVFKIFFYLLNNNYHDFSNYHYPNHQISFFEEFKDKFNERKEAMLNYYLFPNGEEFKKYQEELEKFESYKFNDFNNPIKEFKEYIEKNGIDIYYTISSNLIISNLALKNYVADNNEYAKYSSFTKNLFNNLTNVPEITKKLFLLFSNDEEFNKTMKPKLLDDEGLKEINSTSFEMLLYALRICLQTSNTQKPEGLLYSELISSDCEKKLNEYCLPGNNIVDDYYVTNYYLVEKHLNTLAEKVGAYVCSCGCYYDIEPCGFPKKSSKCFNCGLPIGAGEKPKGNTGQHGMVIREGHYRIFKDKAQKDDQLRRFRDNDENIPNMILADYKSKIIDPIIEKSKFGISKISKIMFEDINQKVRKMSIVGYRLLNFILYSHLFYSNCLGFIKNEDMNKYISDGMTCIKMLVTDWNFLKDTLQSKGIQIIQIFMNMIFDKICEKLKACKEIKTNEEREKFEDEIEKLLEESYKEYEDYSKKYNDNNKEALQLDKHNMKSLMLENNDAKLYDEENYPFYKFFLMTTYPSKEAFINELKKVGQFEAKYPLLASIINKDNDQIKVIKYLPDFNEFENFMIDNYSYKISREEASKLILKDEEIYKNNQKKFKEKFDKFKEIWTKLKPYVTKYGCRDEMPPIDLDENKSLDYFLNDNGEIGKGMYIAAAYQNFIDIQNNFLDGLIAPLSQNGILHHFVKNMEKKIDVQKAKKNETLNFDVINESFMEIIYDNCKRNIFREDNSINYMNYKQYIFNFDLIESNLGDILLPGKMKFNDHEKLRFVTYCFEGLRGNNSSILSVFSEKYKQIPLSLDKKQLIYDSIKDKIKNENEEYLSKILSSIQLLIYYMTQERKNDNEDINLVIQQRPEYVNLSIECEEFFKEKGFKVEEIIEIYSFFELLCFKTIINNLRGYYKEKIDVDLSGKIIKLIEEKKLNIIKKVNLATACRKLISRYLVGNRDDTDINEKQQLIAYLTKEELWPYEICKKEDEIKKDLENINLSEIKVSQVYELYILLGGDEKESFEGINMKNEDEKENNERIIEDGGEAKIIKKIKKKIKF